MLLIFTLSNYKDVDDTVSQVVTRYYEMRENGRYQEMYDLLQSNPELKQYMVDANSLNKIEIGLYDLALKAFYSQKIIFSETEPDTNHYQISLGSEWLQEY